MKKTTSFLLIQMAITTLIILSIINLESSVWPLIFIGLVILQISISLQKIELLVGLSTIINTLFLLFFLIPYIGVVFKILYILISIILVILLLISNSSGVFVFQNNMFNESFKKRNNSKKKNYFKFNKSSKRKSKFETSTTKDVEFEEK